MSRFLVSKLKIKSFSIESFIENCKLLALSKIEGQGAKGVPTEAYKGTPQGETTEDNAADDILMVDQGCFRALTLGPVICYFRCPSGKRPFS